MRWNSRWGLTKRLYGVLGYRNESVIQDVDIPLAKAAEFLDFFHREVGILPIWTCPFQPYASDHRYPLFATDPATFYVNFGFWDVIRTRQRGLADGHFNRKIERQVRQLDGIKSLYSDAYFGEDEFWQIYNKPAFEALKQRYDPDGRLKDLYQKTVLRN